MADKLIMQYSFLGIFYFLIVCIRLILFLVTYQIVYQLTLRFLGALFHYRPIGLFHLTVTEHLIQSGQCLARFGKHHQSADGTIQAVGHPNENIARLIIFLFQVLFHHLRQRSITGLVSLNDFRRSLIDYNNMIILVNNYHITCSYRRQPG